MFKGISALDSEEVIITLIFITLLLIWIFRKLPHIGERVIATLVPIAILLVCILWNRILIKIAIKKITKTENQKMFKQEETPVLDAQELFKQTARKSIVYWILALIPASWIAFLLTSIEVRIEIQRSAYQGRGGLGVFLVIPLFASVNLSIAWGVMIYFFNKKWTLSEVNLTLEQKKKISRYLAYFSFPHVIIRPLIVLIIVLSIIGSILD